MQSVRVTGSANSGSGGPGSGSQQDSPKAEAKVCAQVQEAQLVSHSVLSFLSL